MEDGIITIKKDDEIVDEFKKEYENIEFIGFTDKMRGIPAERNSSFNAIQGLESDTPLSAQLSKVAVVWETLLKDAIVFLKSRDAKERGKHDAFAFGDSGLVKLFKKLGQFESTMAPVLDRNRDHNAHVLRTFLLGWKVARNLMGGSLAEVSFGDEIFIKNSKKWARK